MRNTYNLSSIRHPCGHIGRLQTLITIPVEAGASLQLAIDGVIRLAPTRKEIVSECQLDICGFFVPHRHVYGDDWTNFLLGGVDNTVTFPAGVTVNPAANNAAYLNINTAGATLPQHTVQGYNRIFQRYFAVPNTNSNGGDNQSGFEDLDYYPNDIDTPHDNFRLYGKLAARLPHILNGATGLAVGASGRVIDLTDADSEVPSVTEFDIRTLAEIKSRYKSEVDNAYFSQWYTDLLDEKWGTGVNTDADQRPEYLFRETMFLSGEDVNGTDDATLGSYVGKTLERIQANMGRKIFMEHGVVWIMMLPRFPLIHTDEVHPLMVTNPTLSLYDYFAAEPERYKALSPIQFNPATYLTLPTTYVPNNSYVEPYGQHYRYQTNWVHPNFKAIPGYPFTQFNPTDISPWYYYIDEEYTDTFQTSQLGQWQGHIRIKCAKFSRTPGPLSSIYAGANF